VTTRPKMMTQGMDIEEAAAFIPSTTLLALGIQSLGFE